MSLMDLVHEQTGLDFANLAARFRRKRGQRSMLFYYKKTVNARHQLKKYARCFS
jgi:hypothetical protein